MVLAHMLFDEKVEISNYFIGVYQMQKKIEKRKECEKRKKHEKISTRSKVVKVKVLNLYLDLLSKDLERII
jgi:hypothetical protein